MNMMTPSNCFDLPELAGAFDDLGTLTSFVVAYHASKRGWLKI